MTSRLELLQSMPGVKVEPLVAHKSQPNLDNLYSLDPRSLVNNQISVSRYQSPVLSSPITSTEFQVTNPLTYDPVTTTSYQLPNTSFSFQWGQQPPKLDRFSRPIKTNADKVFATPDQKKMLIESYTQNNYPEPNEMTRLNDITGLDSRFLKQWFQYYRKSMRKKGQPAVRNSEITTSGVRPGAGGLWAQSGSLWAQSGNNRPPQPPEVQTAPLDHYNVNIPKPDTQTTPDYFSGHIPTSSGYNKPMFRSQSNITAGSDLKSSNVNHYDHKSPDNLNIFKTTNNRVDTGVEEIETRTVTKVVESQVGDENDHISPELAIKKAMMYDQLKKKFDELHNNFISLTETLLKKGFTLEDDNSDSGISSISRSTSPPVGDKTLNGTFRPSIDSTSTPLVTRVKIELTKDIADKEKFVKDNPLIFEQSEDLGKDDTNIQRDDTNLMTINMQIDDTNLMKIDKSLSKNDSINTENIKKEVKDIKTEAIANEEHHNEEVDRKPNVGQYGFDPNYPYPAYNPYGPPMFPPYYGHTIPPYLPYGHQLPPTSTWSPSYPLPYPQTPQVDPHLNNESPLLPPTSQSPSTYPPQYPPSTQSPLPYHAQFPPYNPYPLPHPHIVPPAFFPPKSESDPLISLPQGAPTYLPVSVAPPDISDYPPPSSPPRLPDPNIDVDQE